MTLSAWQAVLLGLIQGLTEFLPVSSSGHLVIGQALLNIEADMITFDIFVHVGTLVAVFVAFWGDIAALLRRPFCRFTALILVGCVPAGVMGLLLDDLFSALFNSVTAVACALLLTLMAVRNIDAPWSNRLTQSIRSAVSMRVDWDHTIGRLSFVRALMPDTALVFLNMGEGDALARPVEGTLSHAFSADQPWQEYACEADSPVSCAAAGTVTA